MYEFKINSFWGLPWWSSKLGPHASSAGGAGLIPGQGTKSLNAVQCSQNKNNNK